MQVFNSIIHKLPENTTKESLLNLIEKLNKDCNIDGILLQLPLPKHLNTYIFLDKIDPKRMWMDFTQLMRENFY